MALCILKPTDGGPAYDAAASEFARLYEQVTNRGSALPIVETDDGVSDLVVIGNDAVNDFLMNEVLELRVRSLGIRYGTDDYCLHTYENGGRRVLVLAGGRGRSTLYAVYDYFERYGDCHYFWDGDVIGRLDELPMDGISVVESPRFDYRGLRYFAHRGLKRFQAEHWSLEDWKREIDWMLKKRLNFFMLRIGMDDVWQRAFPEAVPYPEQYRTIEGQDAVAFDDRSDFWTLKYRGELREQLLAYARERDLMYPTDCGTMTHWYSRTPTEFLENVKPTFVHQDSELYANSMTGKVFDFTKKENMDYYMHLTETMVKEYEKSTALFHTIGLGEREMYDDPKKNFALKLIAYRRIGEEIRKRYPDSKLLVGSWDFTGHWPAEEVRKLIAELDPEHTLLFDYTSEIDNPERSFLEWDVVGKFPWIFGLFHAYEAESEIRGPYDRSNERLKVAAEDPYCKGMVLWPELAHSDPLILEYLSQNAWAPLTVSVEALVERYCRNRYGAQADRMNESWQALLPLIKLKDWGGEGYIRPYDNKREDNSESRFGHMEIWVQLLLFADDPDSYGNDPMDYVLHKQSKAMPLCGQILSALRTLASDAQAFDDSFVLRDSIDLTRTVIGRFMDFIVIQALASKKDIARIARLRESYLTLLDIMGQLLSLNDDRNLYRSLEELRKVAPTNPNFEVTLKRNVANLYCSQPVYELVTQIFREEGEVFFDRLLDGGEPHGFTEQREAILQHFMYKPLAEMQPISIPEAHTVIAAAADELERLFTFI